MRYSLICLIYFLLFVNLACSNFSPTTEKNISVHSIVASTSEHLWVAKNSQIEYWDIKNKSPEIFDNLSGNLLIDNQNNLWVFSDRNISYFDKQNWQYFEPKKNFASGQVYSFAEINDYLWVGTLGLSRYDKKNNSWEVFFDSPPEASSTTIPLGTRVEILSEGVHAIAPISADKIWLGTSKGLTYWENNSYQTWSNADLDTDGIRCLLVISDNGLWVCTSHGVGLWQNDRWKISPGGILEPIFLIESNNNEIWSANRDGEVARWNGISWDKWIEPNRLRITSIIAGEDNDIWVGSKDGLWLWNQEKWFVYTLNDGLSSNYINTLFKGSDETIWVGTPNGLDYYNPQTHQWHQFP